MWYCKVSAATGRNEKKEDVYYTNRSERAAVEESQCRPRRASGKSTGISQEAEDNSQRKACAWAFTGAFSEKARQGRENNLGLATLNNSCWFWARRVVSGCLVPGLRMISGRGSISVWALEKEVDRDIDSKLVGLHVKGMLLAGWALCALQELASPGRAVSTQ